MVSERPFAPTRLIRAGRALAPALAALVLAVGVLTTAVTPASASPQAHRTSGAAQGSVSCSLSARLTFSPALTSSDGGTSTAAVRARLSACDASDSSVHVTTGTAEGSFSSSPLTCAGGELGTTGALGTLSITWRGRLGSTVARFAPTSVSAGEATGSFAGLAALALSPTSADSRLCTHRGGLRRLALGGALDLVDPAPSYGPATSVASGGMGDYCATTTSGVVCWGSNPNGELGDGTSTGPDSCTNVCSTIPVPVGISATGLSSDSDGYCAILASDAVDCWGDNSSGELGIGTSVGPDTCADDSPCSTTPVPVGIDATSVVSAGSASCAILTSTAVDCWGDNSFGELGDGSASSGPDQCADGSCSPSPVSTGIDATSLVSDNAGFCAILTSTAVDCWGDNSSGELGVGTTSGPDTCGGWSGDDSLPCSTRPVPTGIDATSLGAGGTDFCAVLTSGGVDCWGTNAFGQLGIGSTSGPDTCLYSDPCSTVPVSTGIAGTSVAGNGDSSCAVLTSGGVDCWGLSYAGQLGDGSASGPDTCAGWSGDDDSMPCSPSPVSTGISATSLSGADNGWCAVLTSGAVDCWGDNSQGQLGAGTATGPESCPGDGTCSTTPVSTGIAATDLASAQQSFCAVLTSGGVDCWGSGFDGSLGDGSTANSDVPTPVLGIP